MRAGENHYDGVDYANLVFESIDWSEVVGSEHDPARRSERKGPTEVDVHVEWATEACYDERRWVRSAGSASGMTIKVTGASPSAGFVVTAVVAPKDNPIGRAYWGATAWKASAREIKQYEKG